MGPLADEENDGNLDLSLMQLTRVPVSEIVSLRFRLAFSLLDVFNMMGRNGARLV